MIAPIIASLPATASVVEFQRHEASHRNREIEWPDNRLQTGKAARERIERYDVAIARGGQRRKAEIEHRREFAHAGRCGWEIGKGAGDQLPYEAEGICEDYRQAQIYDHRALQPMKRDTAGSVDRVRHDPNQGRQREYEPAVA
jgi:hypothetical protein